MEKKQSPGLIFRDEPGNYEQMDVAEYTTGKVVVYGVNVSVLRSAAAIADGLTPVRRRILWTMFHDHKLLPTGNFVKVPEWLYHGSKYHPHGDQGLTAAFGNMIRPWDTNAPMIEVSGFEGSLTGDSHASPRYLDARLSKYAYKCFFEEFDPTIVEMTQNYIQTDMEPVTLPSKYPNFLFNVAVGIGWGNAMNLTTFNFNEVAKLTIALLWNPEMTGVYLFPDSPRGYSVIDDGTIKETCQIGHGSIKVRANATYVEEEHAIDVDGFPEQIYMDGLINQISKLVAEKKLTGIDDTADKSTKDHNVLRIILKKDAIPEQVLAELYKRTSMSSTIKMEFNFAERTHMIHLGLKEAILHWIDRRIDFKQKYYIRKIAQLTERKHSLEGEIKLLTDKNIRKATEIARKSTDNANLMENLQKDFNVTSYQAQVISKWSLSDNASSQREKLQKEYDLIPEKIEGYRRIINSVDSIREDIQKDLEEGMELFGRPRQSKIIKASNLKEVVMSYRIAITNHYIKKMAAGGHLVGTVDSRDDVVGYFKEVKTTDRLMILSDMGRMYTVNLSKIQGCEATTKGVDLLTAIGFRGIAVAAFVITPETIERLNLDPVDEGCVDLNICFITEKGLIKITSLTEYLKSRNDIQAIDLLDGDSVCYATIVDGHSTDQLFYTLNGKGIVFDISTIPVTGRTTKGSSFLSLDKDDHVIGMCDAVDCVQVCVLTNKGYGKICDMDDILKTSKRRADMIRLTSLTEGDSVYMIRPATGDFMDGVLSFRMSSGKVERVRIADIKKTTRISKGTKLIGVKRGDTIVKVRLVQ